MRVVRWAAHTCGPPCVDIAAQSGNAVPLESTGAKPNPDARSPPESHVQPNGEITFPFPAP
ncbi:hypothetical protein C2E23DRAFT_826899 [Lenzites betulinus]|nr:hypothetical protein C2E23DRAFT_826899 [Lenzites betulinus]